MCRTLSFIPIPVMYLSQNVDSPTSYSVKWSNLVAETHVSARVEYTVHCRLVAYLTLVRAVP